MSAPDYSPDMLRLLRELAERPDYAHISDGELASVTLIPIRDVREEMWAARHMGLVEGRAWDLHRLTDKGREALEGGRMSRHRTYVLGRQILTLESVAKDSVALLNRDGTGAAAFLSRRVMVVRKEPGGDVEVMPLPQEGGREV